MCICMQLEYLTFISKNWAKCEHYYFCAKFAEEILYSIIGVKLIVPVIMQHVIGNMIIQKQLITKQKQADTISTIMYMH